MRKILTNDNEDKQYHGRYPSCHAGGGKQAGYFSYAIANRVLELIEGKGMSQRDLARAIGKSETEVSRWLSGTHNLTLATIAKMAVALDDDIIMPTRSAKHYYGPNQSVSSTMVAESEVI